MRYDLLYIFFINVFHLFAGPTLMYINQSKISTNFRRFLRCLNNWCWNASAKILPKWQNDIHAVQFYNSRGSCTLRRTSCSLRMQRVRIDFWSYFWHNFSLCHGVSERFGINLLVSVLGLYTVSVVTQLHLEQQLISFRCERLFACDP